MREKLLNGLRTGLQSPPIGGADKHQASTRFSTQRMTSEKTIYSSIELHILGMLLNVEQIWNSPARDCIAFPSADRHEWIFFRRRRE